MAELKGDILAHDISPPVVNDSGKVVALGTKKVEQSMVSGCIEHPKSTKGSDTVHLVGSQEADYNERKENKRYFSGEKRTKRRQSVVNKERKHTNLLPGHTSPGFVIEFFLIRMFFSVSCQISTKELPTQEFLIHVEKAPKPTVFRIAPSFVKVGEKKHLTIHGWGFDKKHKLVLDGKVVPTVWRSSEQLETKNAVDFTAKQPGQIELYVENDGAIKGTTAKIEVVAKQSTHHISFVSLHSLRTNTIHSDIYLYGGPWTKNAKVFLENNAINANFVSSSILHIKTLSTKGFVPGSLGFVVKDGSVVSHRYHVMLGHGPFSVEVVSPSEGVYLKGTIALSLSAVGEGCGIANVTGSCLEPFEIEFVGPDNVDYGTAGKKKFRLLSSSSYRDGSYRANGNLDTVGLPLGLYKVRFVLKTGRKSTAGLFQLTAGPAPTLYSAAPNIVFPTGTNRITLQGKDFPPGALVLFGKTFIQPSYTTNSEIRFEIPKSALQVGVYQVRVRTPQQQLSNAVSVEVLSPQPPAIYNAHPFIMSAGLVVPQLSIKAESFDSQTQVTLNGVAVPASQLTFQQGMIHVRDLKIPTGVTVGKLQLVNKNGLTSNTFDLLIHDKPYILHITPSLLSPQASPHQVSVFGYGFAPNASLLINGKKLAGAKVEWNRVTFPQNGGVGLVTPLDVDIQVQNPNGLTSNTLKITKVSSSYRPIIERGSISGSSIFAVEAGKSLLQRRTLTLHGQGFTTFTKLYFDGKPLVTSSTSTSITVLESLDFRKSSLGWKSFQAVEGTQKSNRFILPISSPFYLGTFPQVDPIAPFIVRLNQSTTLYMKIQEIHSAQDAFQYDVVVKNAWTIGAGKILPLVFQGGSTCRVVLNATGWQQGLYTLFVRSKNNHKVISGGTGLYVVP